LSINGFQQHFEVGLGRQSGKGGIGEMVKAGRQSGKGGIGEMVKAGRQSGKGVYHTLLTSSQQRNLDPTTNLEHDAASLTTQEDANVHSLLALLYPVWKRVLSDMNVSSDGLASKESFAGSGCPMYVRMSMSSIL